MVTFALTGHRRRLRWLVHGTVLVVWASAGAALLARDLSASNHASLDAFVLWALAGAALLWNAARKGAGRETLTVTPGHLLARRSVGPFHLQHRYDLDRIGIVRLRKEGTDRFKVWFEYDGSFRGFGKNLSFHEASCLASIILHARPTP